MTDQTPAFLTITEAARRLGVSRQRIHQRIKAGSLRAERVQSVTAARFHYMLPADQFVDSPANRNNAEGYVTMQG
jgi:excisionase family DNA binding protein